MLLPSHLISLVNGICTIPVVNSYFWDYQKCKTNFTLSLLQCQMMLRVESWRDASNINLSLSCLLVPISIITRLKNDVWFQVYERKPTVVKNFGVWLRYDSRSGTHNMYREYRDVTVAGAITQCCKLSCGIKWMESMVNRCQLHAKPSSVSNCLKKHDRLYKCVVEAILLFYWLRFLMLSSCELVASITTFAHNLAIHLC